jgi:YggT family protein
MASFIYFILDAILGLLLWAIIINAIISWLVAFDVINLRNRIVYSIAHFLEAVTRPVLRPFQRFIPPLGGVDVTPILAMLVIQGIRIYLLPMAMAPLQSVLG